MSRKEGQLYDYIRRHIDRAELVAGFFVAVGCASHIRLAYRALATGIGCCRGRIILPCGVSAPSAVVGIVFVKITQRRRYGVGIVSVARMALLRTATVAVVWFIGGYGGDMRRTVFFCRANRALSV